MEYIVKKSGLPVVLDAGWDSPCWSAANEVKLENVLERTGDFRPDTRLRMLYDDERICGLFQVKDHYVRAVATADQQSVCNDSCVEFFVHPAGAPRYFNFEMNCGGTMLLYHIKNLRAKEYDEMPAEALAGVERFHTMPKIVDPEIAGPTTWYLGFGIPIRLFVQYSGINPELSGQRWKANFTKCADETSHPHWLTWQPLSCHSFHLPNEFGDLVFA